MSGSSRLSSFKPVLENFRIKRSRRTKPTAREILVLIISPERRIRIMLKPTSVLSNEILFGNFTGI